jgi:hypothetical protein
VINPAVAGQPATLAATVTPVRLGPVLVEVDTGRPGAAGLAVAEVRAALG